MLPPEDKGKYSTAFVLFSTVHTTETIKKWSFLFLVSLFFKNIWTHTVNAGLLVSTVDEQISGTLREPWQRQQLDEAGDGITGKKILPARLAAQNLSVEQ